MSDLFFLGRGARRPPFTAPLPGASKGGLRSLPSLPLGALAALAPAPPRRLRRPQRPPLLALIAFLALAGCDGGKTGPDGDDTRPSETGSVDTGDGDCDGDGWSWAEGDCDCTSPDINPGATEICDGLDNDCDGSVDEGVGVTYYADRDDDGFGDLDAPATACEPLAGYVQSATDCDDADADVFPGAPEACNDIDDDCDGETDEGLGDTWFADADGDGFGDASGAFTACEQPDGAVVDATDCDDADAERHPGADEWCDGVDQDCDGAVDEDAVDAATWWLDYDGDGVGGGALGATACDAPANYVASSDDCDDTDAAVYPGAAETCDGVDEDCDGTADEDLAFDTWYDDADGDGYGDAGTGSAACSAPAGTVANADDCDDTDPDVSPAEAEACDGRDEDCSGSIDDGGVCPCDVVEYDGHAYQLCATALNWYEASDACAADGYHLLTVDDAAEDAFLGGEVAAYGSGYHWWMGASDLGAEGTWAWEDGTAFSYTHWNSGEPNDLFGEDCGTFAYGGAHWNDWNCSNTTSYLCEAP